MRALLLVVIVLTGCETSYYVSRRTIEIPEPARSSAIVRAVRDDGAGVLIRAETLQFLPDIPTTSPRLVRAYTGMGGPTRAGLIVLGVSSVILAIGGATFAASAQPCDGWLCNLDKYVAGFTLLTIGGGGFVTGGILAIAGTSRRPGEVGHWGERVSPHMLLDADNPNANANANPNTN